MVLLQIVYIILLVVSIACAVKGFSLKIRNFGFIVTSVIITLCDFICIASLGIQNARQARTVLVPYYILHAWLLFAMLIMICLIERNRLDLITVAISAPACIYQTYLAVSQLMGARVFSFQKRIYFRRAWWVATDSKNTGLLFSYRSYRIMIYINIVLLLITLVICMIRSHKVFRSRYYSMIAVIVAFGIAESITVRYSLPVWIPGLAYNLIPVLCLYLTGMFASNRLREWSLDSFANDMSDGLILYDEHNDLIHINDMVKDTLEAGLLEDFKDRTKLEDWISRSTSSDNSWVLIYTGNGHDYYFKVGVRQLGDKNKSIGTLYIIHDTTDSMRTILAMQKANEELERASRMKSDFLANMSHEIRTPMNAVIGIAEIAMREKDISQMADYLLQIQSSGRNLLNIINDILDYSKIESGKMEIIPEEYEPIFELEDVANVLATRIGDKPLELFVFVKGEMPHKLYGDNMRIRQILINLANNAIKFTEQGIVRIVLEFIPAGENRVNVSFHVIDTGIGIRKEDLQKLFVSFQQVDSRRNRSAEGTGLGLAISQKLAEAMDGEIGVTSEYGVGSDFWFTIPQQVVDATNDLAILDIENKHAFSIARNTDVIKMFTDEMVNLGMDGRMILGLSEYQPTGGKDYVFIEDCLYDDEMSRFLDAHPDVTGVVFVGFASDFSVTRPNLHILSRPATTMRMVHTLNDQFEVVREIDEEKVFRNDYIAPDARILVVDDNEINLTIAEGLLSPLKVRLDKAGGGREAVEMASAVDYDVIFMDHMMPEIDGIDATRMIRSAHPDSDHPVIIALSANVFGEAKTLFEEAGMNDFVAKPIDVRELTSTLRKWLPPEKVIEIDPAEADGDVDADESVIPVIDGLNTETAISALGSETLYGTIAGEYYRSGDEKWNGIKDSFDRQDWTDYTIRVHALKSSSRQIGAMDLGTMAEALEKAGKAGDIDTILKDTDATLEAFRQLLDKLQPYYGTEEGDDSDKPPIDPDTLNLLLDELSTACDDLDMDAMESVGDRLRGYSYDDDAKELISGLHQAIGNIDTDECMEIIAKLR